MNKILIYVLSSMVASSTIALAQSQLEARVVSVLSGDMLIVSIDHQAEIVHLYGVECPRGKAGWLKARHYIRQMVMHKKIMLETVGPKRYGAIQAKVYVGELCINDALADVLLANRQHQPEP